MVNKKKTEVIISKVCGLCYGSNNAITKTQKVLNENKNVVLYKEILHNKNVLDELSKKGALVKNDLRELSKDDYVIIRAHGEPFTTFNTLGSSPNTFL